MFAVWKPSKEHSIATLIFIDFQFRLNRSRGFHSSEGEIRQLRFASCYVTRGV